MRAHPVTAINYKNWISARSKERLADEQVSARLLSVFC
jgi:hypothetical protein